MRKNCKDLPQSGDQIILAYFPVASNILDCHLKIQGRCRRLPTVQGRSPCRRCLSRDFQDLNPPRRCLVLTEYRDLDRIRTS